MRQAIVAAWIVVLAGAGCSVGMALHGHHDPNVAALRVGQDRDEVIVNIGQPSSTTTTADGGRIDIFRLERGDEPSAGRAVGHAAMDVLTLGAWEVIGVPVEAFTGDKFTLTITYDTTDKVTHIQTGSTQGAF
jgi:hypothetical protein